MTAAVFLGLLIRENPMNDGILTQVINQYTGSISNIQSASAGIGLGLFNTIAAIAIAVLALNHLLRKNVDMVDSNFELIKLLIYLDFFYYFIVNYNLIYSLFFGAVNEIAGLLGAKAVGVSTVTDIKAQNIFHIGFLIAKNIWATSVTFNLWRDFQMILISVPIGLFVLYCFAVIGLELILVQIGSQIILAGGIFLLAFSGLTWTREYAERYVHTFFHIGIKMIFIYILIGLGLGLAKTWTQSVPDPTDIGKIINYEIELALSAYIYYKLCLKVPDQAVSWLTGRMSMGFDTAADVKSAVTAIPKIAAATARGVVAMAGNAKAYDAAKQVAKARFQAQGKIAGTQDIINETMKTLGAANRDVKQAAWDKKVGDTQGGKVAKDIIDQQDSTGGSTDSIIGTS